MNAELSGRIQELEKLCLLRGWKIGSAESCTGGLLASWICAWPGVSKFFQGAVVSYARSVKEDVLGVPRALILAHGEVSLPVARQMALGARSVLAADWTVSITGIAGPSGGSPGKPVGTVCFAVTGPGFERLSQQAFPAGAGREDIQRQAALFAFDFLLSAMR
ncbi:MAG: CinA family protein [Bdellovibrionales bacterium]|nr:CinA family protein [Bdellovibrionales bacterium]